MSLREEQCNKVCRILDNVLANRPTERDSLIVAVRKAFAEPKRGKWIEDKGQQTLMQNFIERGEVWRVCSVCGAGHMIGHKYESDKAYHETYHNFCPHCGAKMEGTT